MGKEQDETDEVLRQHVRHEMCDGEPQPRHAQRTRARHEGLGAYLKHLRAQHAGKARPVRKAHTHEYPECSAAKRIAYEDKQNEVRNAHNEVREPFDRGVEATSAERRSHSKHDRDDGGHRRRRNPDEHGRGEPGERAAEHIAPHPIRAEGMRERGRKVFLGEIRCSSGACERAARDSDCHEHKRSRDKQPKRTPTPAAAPSRGNMERRRKGRRGAAARTRLHVCAGANAAFGGFVTQGVHLRSEGADRLRGKARSRMRCPRTRRAR